MRTNAGTQFPFRSVRQPNQDTLTLPRRDIGAISGGEMGPPNPPTAGRRPDSNTTPLAGADMGVRLRRFRDDAGVRSITGRTSQAALPAVGV